MQLYTSMLDQDSSQCVTFRRIASCPPAYGDARHYWHHEKLAVFQVNIAWRSDNVWQYVTTCGNRVEELQEQDLETFGCKHGLVAALVFQSEHVALDFRRPSTEVEVQKPLRTTCTPHNPSLCMSDWKPCESKQAPNWSWNICLTFPCLSLSFLDR